MKNKKTVYGSIAEDILAKIQNDTYKIGTLLPPERELMGIYKVERTTVRRGLELLKNEGYIIKAAGLGSVVNSKVPTQAVKNVAAAPKAKEKKAKDKNVLVIFPYLREVYEYSDLSFISDVTSELKKLCKITTAISKSISETIGIIENGSFDGCIVFGENDERIFDAINTSSIPCCTALGLHQGFPCVIPDIYAGSKSALSMLKGKGHKTSAFIGPDEKASFDKAFSEQFLATIKAFDFENCQDFINIGGKDERSGFDRLSELIRTSGSKFTCVCAFNDETARGVLKAAKHYGLDVPNDISVISLLSSSKDNDFDSIYVSPKDFAESLIICLREDTPCCTVLTKTEYIEAGSVISAKDTSSGKRRLSDFLL